MRSKKSLKYFSLFSLFTLTLVSFIFVKEFNAATVGNDNRLHEFLAEASVGRFRTGYRYLEETKQPAYCLNYELPAPPRGSTITTTRPINNVNIENTLKYGYPSTYTESFTRFPDTTEGNVANFYVTQIVIWSYEQNWSLSFLESLVPQYDSRTPSINENDVKARIIQLRKYIDSLGGVATTPKARIEGGTTQDTTSNNGDTETPLRTVVIENVYGGTVNISTPGAPSGTRVVDENGNTITSFNISANTKNTTKKFKVVVPSSAKTFNPFKVQFSINGKVIDTMKYVPNDPGYQDLGVATVNGTLPAMAPPDYTVNSNITDGNLVITKTDDTSGASLQGAIFNVTGPNGYNRDFVTDGSGSATLTGIPAGTYTVTETKAPAGYILNSSAKTANVTAGNTTNLTVTNAKNKGTLVIVKQGSDGRKLEGAQFTVKQKSDGSTITTVTTDANGEARVGNLSRGTYIVEEIKAPEGYLLSNSNTQEVTFFADANDTATSRTVTFTNDKVKGTALLYKMDTETGDLLADATFKITGPDGYNVTKTTNADGVVTLANIVYGNYTIEEIQSPNGYVKGGPWNFSITENGKEIGIDLQNRPIRGDIKLYKTDEDNGEPVKGVEFRITGPNGYNVTEVTDDNGIITLSNVLYGNYHVVETRPAQGYLPATKEWDIMVEHDGQMHELRITNKPITADLKITKTNDDGSKTLAGSKFCVQSVNIPDQAGMKLYDQTEVTDINGEINLTGLRYGEYRITEVEPPEGYLRTTEPIRFTVDGTKNLIDVSVTNELILGNLEVLKTDRDTGEPLQGAKFRIQGVTEPNFREDITTKANGVATFTDLPYGRYTVQEIQAPTGYVLDNRIYEINLTTKGQTIHLEHTNKINEGRIEVIKTDRETKAELSNARFEVCDANGVKVSSLVTDKNGRATTGLLRYGHYTLRETKAPTGYLLNNKTYDIFVEEEGKTYTTPVENQVKKGKIRIVKTDGLDKTIKVPGIEFSVWLKGQDTDTEQPICKIVTDENGEAITPDLRYGEYVIKETNTTEAYYLNEDQWEVFIEEDGKVYTLRIVNQPVITKLKLTKTSDQTGKGLVNAKFQIWNTDTNQVVTFTDYDKENRPIPITTFTTDKEGCFSIPSELRYGNYKLVEVEAPTGFLPIADIQFSVNKQTPFIDKDGEMWLEFEATDEIIRGDLEFTKTSKDTEAVLPGVTFELVRVTNPEDHELGKVDEYVTNSEGKIVVTDLPYGEYYLKEIATLEGYALDETEIPFMIQEDGVKLDLSMDNRWIRGNVKLVKTDIDTNEKIEGVKFELYNHTGREFALVEEYVTDKNGEILIENLPYGKYQLIESETLENYVLDKTPIDFFIQEDGKTVELSMTNEKKKGDLQITKTDVATGELLPDAGFTIWAEDKKTEIIKGVTDENGVAYFKELPYGKYFYQEHNAPEGYVIDERLFPFEIKEDGEVVKAEMTNEMIKGTLELNKLDISTGELIPNAKFAISQNLGTNEEPKRGDIVKKGVTDENGIFIIEDLPYGKYVYEEIEAPEGYVLNDALMPFEIKDNGAIVKAEVPNEKIRGSLNILKVDAKTAKPLEGAYFEVYRKDDKDGENPIFKGTSDKNGKLTFENVEYGDYYVKEIRAPKGYDLKDIREKFSIEDNGEVIDTTFKNKQLPQKARLSKTGAVLSYGAIGLCTASLSGVVLMKRKSKKK